jgi:soluble lytic murein transglycosylase
MLNRYIGLIIVIAIAIMPPLLAQHISEKTKLEIETALSLYRKTDRHLKENTPDDVLNAIISTQQKILNPFSVKAARLKLAEYYLEKNAIQSSISIIDRYLLDPSDTVIYPKVKILQIQIFIKTKQSKEALNAYKDLISVYPHFDINRHIFDDISELFEAPLKPNDILPSIKDKLDYITHLFEAKAYTATIDQIKLFKDFFTGSAYLQDIIFYQGVSNYHVSQFLNAQLLLDEALGLRKLHHEQWPEAHYWFSKALKATHKSDWAQQEMMHALEIAKPTDWFLGEAYYHVVTYFRQSKVQPNDLKKYEDDFAKYASKSPYFEKYHWEKSPQPSPEVRQRLFQIYSQLIKQSDTITNKNIDPMVWGQEHIPVTFSVEKVYTQFLASKSESQWNPWKQFVDEMKGFGLESTGYDHLRHRIFTSKTLPKDEIEAILYLHFNRREYPQGIQSMSEYIPSDELANGIIPGKLLQYYYPRLYWAWITDACKKYDVDPYLLLTLIRQRSHFNTTLTLNGNMGLCQLSPTLAEDLSKAMGIKWSGPEELLMPQRNIIYGAFYLSQLKKSYAGNYAMMIAAFSTDTSTVNLWIGNPPKLPDTLNDTISTVVYTQTRDTIREVLGNYLIYRMITPEA